MADRRTEQPNPPDEPDGQVEWWHELIDDPRSPVAEAQDPDTDSSPEGPEDQP